MFESAQLIWDVKLYILRSTYVLGLLGKYWNVRRSLELNHSVTKITKTFIGIHYLP